LSLPPDEEPEPPQALAPTISVPAQTRASAARMPFFIEMFIMMCFFPNYSVCF
jgi:hypothetical protein